MKSFLISSLTLLLGTAFIAAEEPAPNIRVELQVVQLPQEVALPLIPGLMNEAEIDATYQKIQELLASGAAKLIAWSVITTQGGQRAQFEAVDEIRFASEYSPPTVSFTPSASVAKPISAEVKVDVSQLMAIPKSSETRHTGVTLEVEPVLLPDGRIAINLVPQHVLLLGSNKISVETKGAGGGTVTVEQPIFETHKVQTSLNLRNGERTLLGVFSTTEPPKHLELFLLKVEAKKVK
jgi:Flp pilus assembly secretin CpaC